MRIVSELQAAVEMARVQVEMGLEEVRLRDRLVEGLPLRSAERVYLLSLLDAVTA